MVKFKPQRAFFVSDLHIKTLNERNAKILLNFLEHLKDETCTHLFLVGDLFDFWVGDHDYYLQIFSPFVKALELLKSKGTEVVYFEGNHDVHVKKFWESRSGIPTFTEPRTFRIGPLKVRVEHGDDINPNDTIYLRYRKFIRLNPLEKLAHILPAQEFRSIGKCASRWSRKRSSGKRRDHRAQMVELIHSYATRMHQLEKFDLIVTGHVHVKDDWKSEGFRSVNLGSWYEEPAVFELTVLPNGEWNGHFIEVRKLLSQ